VLNSTLRKQSKQEIGGSQLFTFALCCTLEAFGTARCFAANRLVQGTAGVGGLVSVGAARGLGRTFAGVGAADDAIVALQGGRRHTLPRHRQHLFAHRFHAH